MGLGNRRGALEATLQVPYRAGQVATLTFGALTFLSLASSARADGCGWHPPEPARTNVASMNANDLITQGQKPVGML